jgi:hypothetical protein
VPVFGLALAPKLLGQIFLKFHIGGWELCNFSF